MNALTFPLPNHLMVLTAPRAASVLMLEFSARLSAVGDACTGWWQLLLDLSNVTPDLCQERQLKKYRFVLYKK